VEIKTILKNSIAAQDGVSRLCWLPFWRLVGDHLYIRTYRGSRGFLFTGYLSVRLCGM
jgi:hypothetical protein